MTEQYAIEALKRKRAELTSRIEQNRAEMRQLVLDLDAVDATLKIFDPNIELEAIKPSAAMPWQQAFRGEIFRIVLETLRASPRPATAYEIAMHVMATKQLNTADKRLTSMFEKRVSSVLRHHRQRGKLRSTLGPGRRMLWEIAN
jgi:hypothetical protein